MTSWDGTTIATAPRLTLRTFRADDLPLYAALNSDPPVYEFLGGQPLSREDSDDIAAWAQDLYAAERTSTGTTGMPPRPQPGASARASARWGSRG